MSAQKTCKVSDEPVVADNNPVVHDVEPKCPLATKDDTKVMTTQQIPKSLPRAAPLIQSPLVRSPQNPPGRSRSQSVAQVTKNLPARGGKGKAVAIDPSSNDVPHAAVGTTTKKSRTPVTRAKKKDSASLIQPIIKAPPPPPTKGISLSLIQPITKATPVPTKGVSSPQIQPITKAPPVPAKGLSSRLNQSTSSHMAASKRSLKVPVNRTHAGALKIAPIAYIPNSIIWPSPSTSMDPNAVHIRAQESLLPGKPSPTPVGAQCHLCGLDLAFSLTLVDSYTKDHPISAVLPCGHHFHASCLEQIGCSTENSKDIPCTLCSC